MSLAPTHEIGRRKYVVPELNAKQNRGNTNVKNTPLLQPQSLVDKKALRKAHRSAKTAAKNERRHLRLQSLILQMKHDLAGRRSCRRCILGVGEENEIEGDVPDLSQHRHGKAQTEQVPNVCRVRHVTARRSRGSKKAEARAWEEPEIDGDSFTLQSEADGITRTENRGIDQFSLPLTPPPTP